MELEYISTAEPIASEHSILREFYIGQRILKLKGDIEKKYRLKQNLIQDKTNSFEISMDMDKFIGYINDIEKLKLKFQPMKSYDDLYDIEKCEIMIHECKKNISQLMNLSMDLFNKEIKIQAIYHLL